MQSALRAIGLAILSTCFLLNPSPAQTDDLAALSNKASEAMAAQRFDEATALYRQLWRALPEETGLRKNLGLALYSGGHYREAITHFERVLKRQPGDASVSFLLGMSHVKLGNVATALVPLRRAVAAEPGTAMFRFELADALNSTGRPEEAIPHFLKLTQLQPANPDAWYGLGAAYTLSSRRSFSEIERTAPESGYWYALLARSRAEQNEFRSAFYLYRQALGKLPDLHGAHAALAAIYHQTKHEDWAAVESQREHEMGPPDCGAHPLECQFQSGRLQEIAAAPKAGASVEALYWSARASSDLASQAFNRLMNLPQSAASHRLQAELLRLQNRHEESAKECRQALKLAPGNRAIELELAKSLRANQDHKDAERLLAELLTREPDSGELNYLMGSSLLTLQEAERAIQYLEKAARRDPESKPIHADLGRAYLQIGELPKAILNLEAAVSADQEGDLYYLLSEAYRRTGRSELAQRALEKRQELVKAAQARADERERNYAVIAP